MRSAVIASAIAISMAITGAAFAQEAGFGGQSTNPKNQVPGPGVEKPTDPAAGNPGSPAQVPTAPQVQRDLYGSSGAATGEPAEPMPPPAPPPPQ
jgi:hypothetical protein